MCRFTLAVVAAALAASGASAQHLEEFVQRTPPRKPVADTQERAGYNSSVGWWAIPGVSPHEAGGYVGGARLTHNNALKKGATVAPGPTYKGTYGWDFVGFHIRPGRVFLRESYDASRGPQISREYRAESPIKVYDPIAARPFRKAVIEAKEEHHEKHESGGEGE